MRTITFTIPGEPQGKQRPRSAFRGGRVHTYDPEENAVNEQVVVVMFRQAVRDAGLDWAPCKYAKVQITACYGLPKGKSRAWRADALAGRLYPSRKPDLDNVAKLVLDALNGIAWQDDAGVVSLQMWKCYEETSRVIVTVMEV